LKNKTDDRLKTLVTSIRNTIKRTHLKVWETITKELEIPRRVRREVNVSRISRYGDEGKIIIIPGKVLGAGKIEKRLTVAALSFSQQAKRKIEEAGGKCLMIENVLESNPKGDNIQLIG
jgi:large subunit ribosomal protein L18e